MILQTTEGQVASPERLAALRRSGLLRGDTFSRLDRLTELAATLTGAPVALISMVDEARQVFTSQHGLDQVWADEGGTPMSHSICSTVVETREALRLPALGEDPDFHDHPARAALRVEAYCGVPIRDPDGYVLGSFCVIDHEPHDWDDDTIVLLELLAELVTDAVATSREYTRMVHDLQQRLLPAELPRSALGTVEALYRPVPHTEDIGGDLYDVITQPDGGLTMVVGDVIGHGVASTQAAAQLRAAVLATLRGPASPDPATTINRIAEVCADLPGCDYAALLVLDVAADGATIRWARAGAMPLVVVRDGVAELHEAGACPPLGVAPCAQHPDCTTVLSPGDSVLALTDGVVERRGEHLDRGFARLLAAAGATPPLDELIDRVMPEPVQGDDIALLRWRHTAG